MTAETDFNKVFSDRTKTLSIKIINIISDLPYSDKVSVIRKQIIRSCTSVASNYRAMCRARSNKEKYAKICIVVEEADETMFWIELIEELKLIEKTKLTELKNEIEEILKSTSAYKKRIGTGL